MSFAMEAILFNLPARFFYSGDSNPAIGFLPANEMGIDGMLAKSKIGKPCIFKSDYSAKGVEAIPDDFPIPIL